MMEIKRIDRFSLEKKVQEQRSELNLFVFFDVVMVFLTIYPGVTFCLETKSNQKVQEILILPRAMPRRPGKISSSPQVFQ